MNYSLELTLPGLPKPTNRQNVHWRVRQKHNKLWKQRVFAAAWPFKPPEPLKAARVTIVRHSSVCPDFDGMVSAGKHLIDGLKQAGIIVDDKMSVIGQPTYEWVKAPPKKGFITIKVEERGS